MEEERLGKGADDRMFKATYPKMFEGAKYAERLPIGKAEIIKTFKPEAIKSFYRDWYRPNLMAVIVVGDIDPAEAERLIKAHFEKLKNPKNKAQKPRSCSSQNPIGRACGNRPGSHQSRASDLLFLQAIQAPGNAG